MSIETAPVAKSAPFAISLVANEKGAKVASLPNRKDWLATQPTMGNAEGKRAYAEYLRSASPLLAACENKATEGLVRKSVVVGASGQVTVKWVKPSEDKPKATKSEQAVKAAKLASAKALLESNVDMDVICASLGLSPEEVDAYVEANA